MISKILTGTFFKAVLILNALMVLLPVFFLFNSSLRDTGSFAANPIELARKPAWRWRIPDLPQELIDNYVRFACSYFNLRTWCWVYLGPLSI